MAWFLLQYPSGSLFSTCWSAGNYSVQCVCVSKPKDVIALQVAQGKLANIAPNLQYLFVVSDHGRLWSDRVHCSLLYNFAKWLLSRLVANYQETVLFKSCRPSIWVLCLHRTCSSLPHSLLSPDEWSSFLACHNISVSIKFAAKPLFCLALYKNLVVSWNCILKHCFLITFLLCLRLVGLVCSANTAHSCSTQFLVLGFTIVTFQTYSSIYSIPWQSRTKDL